MSSNDPQRQKSTPDGVAEKIAARRDALEDLAESSLPCADLAEALLEINEGDN